MSAPGAIARLAIVGGGTAGWMSAVLLNRFLGPGGCRVVLVEAPGIETIGVGEATIPAMVKFVRALGLDEDEFMRRCGATYKLAIRFEGWAGGAGGAYWHPFGLCGGMIEGLDLFHFWLRERLAGREARPYVDYSLQAHLAAALKAPRPVGGTSPIMQTGTYAYHLDAAALARYLCEIATAEGVEHIRGEVRNVVPDGRGGIASVETADGRRLAADLFVDCTGFRARLIGEALGDAWIDWSSALLCDRAVALPRARDPDMPPFTRAAALAAGWAWRIPLAGRVGCGYVYSSAHADDEAALRALAGHAAADAGGGADPRFLRIRVGHRKTFWAGNCVAVGLAAGFIEPLESTGIFFIQRALELLLEYLPDRDMSPVLVRRYNRRMAAIYEEVRDFVLLHYLLNDRDEPFWRAARAVPVPDSLAETMALFEAGGRVEGDAFDVFRETSYYFILTGSGRLPRRAHSRMAYFDVARVPGVLGEIRDQNAGLIARLPLHRDLMARIHRTAP